MKDEVVENMWHVYSDGTRADIPFNTDEDKLYAWNSVAICAEIAGVQVWVSTSSDYRLGFPGRVSILLVIRSKRTMMS